MPTPQAMWSGAMLAWTPSLVVLAWLLPKLRSMIFSASHPKAPTHPTFLGQPERLMQRAETLWTHSGRPPVLLPGQMAGANPAVRPIVWSCGIAQFVPILNG